MAYRKQGRKDNSLFYNFMENHKTRGTVSVREVNEYMGKKNLTGAKIKGHPIYVIRDRTGQVANVQVNKKNRVNMWMVW